MDVFVFVADNTIPGLGASDLARWTDTRHGRFAGLPAGRLGARGLTALRRAFRNTDNGVLRDLGLDWEAC